MFICVLSVCVFVEGSLHSSDSVSDSNSPPSGQTGVPTQVVQQVQTAQVTTLSLSFFHTHTCTSLHNVGIKPLMLSICIL